jgi:ankyrin repeat protein
VNDQVQKPIVEKANGKKKVGEILETTSIMIKTKTKTQAELNEELFQEVYNNKAPSKEKKDFSKIIELVKAGADVNAFDDKWQGDTPLMSAAFEGNIDLVNLLFELGADVNTNKKKYDNVLYEMCLYFENGCYPEHYEIVNELIKHKVEINLKDEQGHTPLMLNVMNGGLFIRELIKAGANVNVIDNNGNSILYYSIENNSKEDVIDLINAGVKIDERAFVHALNNRNQEIIEILEKRRKKQNKINKKLLVAFMKKEMDIVKEYLKEGANIDTKDKDGWTPLMYTVLYENLELVKELIELGADVNERDGNRMSVLDIARSQENEEILKLIKDKSGYK